MTLTGQDWETLIALSTPLITAFLTAYVTTKANERALHNVMDRVEELEARIFNHETRISRLEEKVRS